jgi:ribosomal protein L11 methyltransferase
VAATWLRVTARSPSDELSGLLAEGLLACGGTAIEERGGALVTYVPLDEGVAEILARIREELHAVLGVEPAQLEGEQVPEQDWLSLWRSGLQPRHVGERIIVSPTWSDVRAGPRDIVIRIDPQMAFGTGEHASTRGVLTLLQQVEASGSHLLDVGSGSAILAIAGVLLGAEHVVAAESDEDAQANAAENVARNGVAGQVTLLCAHVDDAFLAQYGGGAFHGIVANVLSSVLVPLLPAFHRALATDGWAILSGILNEEADTVRHAAERAGFDAAAEHSEEQWWSVTLRRH